MKIRFLISNKTTLARVFHLTILSALIILSFQFSHPEEVRALRNLTLFSFGWCGISALMQKGNFPNKWGWHVLAFFLLLLLTGLCAAILRIWI